MIKILIIIAIAIFLLFITIFAVYYSVWSKIDFKEYELKRNRNIHELLIILSEQFEYEIKEYFEYITGLCAVANLMKDSYHYTLHIVSAINDKEYQLLYNYIYKYRPNKIKTEGYWWPAGKIEPRRKWLKRHIFITGIIAKFNLL